MHEAFLINETQSVAVYLSIYVAWTNDMNL